jgi:hypothetical protein
MMGRVDVWSLAAALGIAGLVGCGGAQHSDPPPLDRSGPSEGAAASQRPDEAGRKLTKDECDELASWIVQVCHTDTSRSSQVEGWCSDVVSKSADGAWQADDCAKHIRYVDFACFRSTESSRSLMDCDRTVNR